MLKTYANETVSLSRVGLQTYAKESVFISMSRRATASATNLATEFVLFYLNKTVRSTSTRGRKKKVSRGWKQSDAVRVRRRQKESAGAVGSWKLEVIG